MKTNKLLINTKDKNYSIIIGANVLDKISIILKKERIKFNKCLIIVDKRVPKKIVVRFKKKINTNKIFLKNYISNEKNKNYKNVNKIHKILFNKMFNREDCVISFGGGITGDVVGFASSTFKEELNI